MVEAMTPTCPACGAKFQHDGPSASCRQCGLPDEVASHGASAVERWRLAQGYKPRGSASKGRKRRAHGRTKASQRRAATATPRPRYRRAS